MGKQYSKLIKSLSSKITHKYLEDLQYNLSTFLNEDIYLRDFSLKDTTSLKLLETFIKAKLIYIANKDGRILLLPTGETLLIELNYLLLYID